MTAVLGDTTCNVLPGIFSLFDTSFIVPFFFPPWNLGYCCGGIRQNLVWSSSTIGHCLTLLDLVRHCAEASDKIWCGANIVNSMPLHPLDSPGQRRSLCSSWTSTKNTNARTHFKMPLDNRSPDLSRGSEVALFVFLGFCSCVGL